MIKKNIKAITYNEFVRLLKPLVDWITEGVQIAGGDSGIFIKKILVEEVQNKGYIYINIEMSYGPCIYDTGDYFNSFDPSDWEAGSKDFSFDFYFRKDDYSFINSHFSEEDSECGEIIQKPDYDFEPEIEDIYVEYAPEVLEELCNDLYNIYGPNVHSVRFVCDPSIRLEKHEGARSHSYYEPDEYAQAEAYYESDDLYRTIECGNKDNKNKYFLRIEDCDNDEIGLIFTMEENIRRR